MTFAAWIIAMIGPLVTRILSALGLGIATYAAYNLIATQIHTQVVAHWGGMAGSVAQIAGLAGFGEAFGILLAALSARAAVMAISKIERVV